ncbi:non-homologous end-joining DNA ligase [Anaerobacillus sp. MEB173]|uniref:non-homologous end-joining DNA ligase n=1 Tax=Anaerobacillus sp. MEB173 TaxID=3383345 RepID=UPI003F9036C0
MGISTKERAELTINGQQLTITSMSKPLWPKIGIKKIDYLQYLIKISNYMLPFLANRLLTVIRYPHGAKSEAFYQKNCPDYAPDFINTHIHDDINYIICSDLPTLIWLGNQLAFEYHVPFQTVHSMKPTEIVFDLDPPSQNEFHLAIEAALILKDILDKLKLHSFVKTSGNKGLQLYIPLPDHTYTYDQTRQFTAFIANYLTSKEPKWFTTERLKVKRDKRLYVDYIQHAEGKTIIAPYSIRGNEEALAATPLFWDEVGEQLHPSQFPMTTIVNRLETKGNPFANFFDVKEQQNFDYVLQWLEANGS